MCSLAKRRLVQRTPGVAPVGILPLNKPNACRRSDLSLVCILFAHLPIVAQLLLVLCALCPHCLPEDCLVPILPSNLLPQHTLLTFTFHTVHTIPCTLRVQIGEDYIKIHLHVSVFLCTFLYICKLV